MRIGVRVWVRVRVGVRVWVRVRVRVRVSVVLWSAGFLLRISLAGTVAFIAGTTRPHRITMRHFFNGFRITS